MTDSIPQHRLVELDCVCGSRYHEDKPTANDGKSETPCPHDCYEVEAFGTECGAALYWRRQYQELKAAVDEP